jgi:hypothetical protein
MDQKWFPVVYVLAMHHAVLLGVQAGLDGFREIGM